MITPARQDLAASSVFRAGSVFTYVALALAMHATRGHFDPGWVLGFSLVFGAWSILEFRTRAGSPARLPKAGVVIWSMVVLFVVLAAIKPHVLYSSASGREQLGILSTVLLLCLAGLAAARHFAYSRTHNLLLAATWISLLIVRLMVLSVSPAPEIDVFTSNTHGADVFLSGHNPYRAEYPDIYGGRYDYSPGFVYWPAVLLVQAGARLVFGDIRMANVLADCLTWLFSFLLLRRHVGSATTGAFAWLLAWFVFPVQLFVLEQSWVDPILVAIVAATMYCLAAEKWLWSAIAVGVGLATKQYFAVFAVLWGIWMIRRCGPTRAVRLWLVSAGVLSLLLLPFFISDADAFLRMTVYVPLRQAFRPDSFSLLAYFFQQGAPAGSWYYLPGVVALVSWAARLWRRPAIEMTLTDLARGGFLVFTCLFLFGKQAFCNYYMFAAFFLWLVIAPISDESSRSGGS